MSPKRASQNTIAVLFDFDHTLGPDSTSAFLASRGVDVRKFWAEEVEPLVSDGWDPVPAYLYRMLGRGITRDSLCAFGRKVAFYPGVTRIFEALRRHVRGISSELRIEFYLISSGIGEILRACRIAREFRDLWANEFHYGKGGEIEAPRNVVSFTDKTRFVFQISKGLVGPEWRGKPFEVNRKVAPEALHVPLDQMIFVGDGYTDVPCFSLIRKSGGVAIGVYDPKDRKRWGQSWGFVEDGRVSNLAPADYRPSGSLHASLLMAVDSLSRRIAMRARTYQG